MGFHSHVSVDGISVGKRNDNYGKFGLIAQVLGLEAKTLNNSIINS